MRQLIVLSMAVLCGGVAYWAFKTMTVKDTPKQAKPVKKARKEHTDKGKKRGPYKKGTQS